MARREERRKAREERKKEKEKDKLKNKQKVGVIGHFVTNKAMVINPDSGQVEPEKDKDEPKKLLDLSVVKRGVNFTSKAKKDDLIKEEAFLRAEEDRL